MEETAMNVKARTPTTGATAHAGAAPLGVTVVEDEESLPSCVTVEGIEPCVRAGRRGACEGRRCKEDEMASRARRERMGCGQR